MYDEIRGKAGHAKLIPGIQALESPLHQQMRPPLETNLLKIEDLGHVSPLFPVMDRSSLP